MKQMFTYFLFVIFSLHGISQNTTDSVAIGATMVRFQQHCASKQPGISWVHVHENETTAVITANQIIDSLGKGCFVTWQHSGNRYVTYTLNGQNYKFDPNRIYTFKGLEATLKVNGAFAPEGYQAAQQLASLFISKYVDSNKLIVALHNNSDSGGLHIKSYLPGGEYGNDAAQVNVNVAEDIDDFFYTTDQRIFDYLKNKGFNILLQNNATVTDDGSLSVYCGYKGMVYLNIEAQLGHIEQQKRMMLAVYQMIDDLFKE
jgi:hypothetical protein